MSGVSIVVPTVNEADNIDPLFQRIFAAEIPEDVEIEIIVVDDSSTDNTRERVKRWTRQKPVKLICREGRAGLANAVVAGARAAAYEYVLVMDADLSHPPEKIAEMIQPLLDNECDMVIGSRYVEAGATPQWPLSRKIASRLASLPALLFTDVNDPMAGFFATSTNRLSTLRDNIPGFKIGFEVLAVGGEQLSVREIPIIFHDRFEGFSKMNKQVIFDYVKQIFQLSNIYVSVYTPARIMTLIFLGVMIDSLFFNILTTVHQNRLLAHISSITLSCTVLSYSIYRFWKGTARSRQFNWFQFSCGLLLLVASISVQGAVFQLMKRLAGMTEGAAFFCGSVVGVSLFVIMMIVFGFSGYHQLENRVRLKLAAAGLIGYGIVIRLFYLGLPELMEQEAYYWNYANHFDLSYLDHPPMVASLIWLGTTLFGTNEFGVRVAGFGCWFVTAFFGYRLSSRLFGRTAGIGAVVLLSWLPIYYGSGMIMTPEAPLLAAWSALLYFLYRSLFDNKRSAWFGVGLSLGLGMISKYTIVLLGPAIICFMVLDRNARRWFLRPDPYLAVCLALVIFSPVLIWNYQHDWVSFLFQGEQRVTGRTVFTTHLLGGYILLILTPAGVLAALYFLFKGNRFFNRVAEKARTVTGLGINRSYGFLLLMTASPLLVFLFFSFTREVKLNWTAPLWLSVLPFLGCSVMSFYGALESGFLKVVHWLWKPTLVILALLMSISMHYVTLGLPGVPHSSGPFLTGWDELARDIERVVSEVEQETGDRPVVVGMDPYQISSGLAFYRTKNELGDSPDRRSRGVEETLGWHLFGWNSLMYAYWAKPEEYRRANIVVVGSSRNRVESPYFQRRVKREKPIFILHAKKDGQILRQLFVRQLYDYRPRPFRRDNG